MRWDIRGVAVAGDPPSYVGADTRFGPIDGQRRAAAAPAADAITSTLTLTGRGVRREILQALGFRGIDGTSPCAPRAEARDRGPRQPPEMRRPAYSRSADRSSAEAARYRSVARESQRATASPKAPIQTDGPDERLDSAGAKRRHPRSRWLCGRPPVQRAQPCGLGVIIARAGCPRPRVTVRRIHWRAPAVSPARRIDLKRVRKGRRTTLTRWTDTGRQSTRLAQAAKSVRSG